MKALQAARITPTPAQPIKESKKATGCMKSIVKAVQAVRRNIVSPFCISVRIQRLIHVSQVQAMAHAPVRPVIADGMTYGAGLSGSIKRRSEEDLGACNVVKKLRMEFQPYTMVELPSCRTDVSFSSNLG